MQTAFAFDAAARRRYTGHEPEIDWDSVSGLDLASTPALLARWLRSPTRRREELALRAAARRHRRATRAAR